MIPIKYYDKGNPVFQQEEVAAYCEELLEKRDKVSTLDDWCEAHLPTDNGKKYTFRDVVKATPEKLILLKQHLDSLGDTALETINDELYNHDKNGKRKTSWEAAEFANHFKLDNLVAIVDHNHMQSLDYCNNTLEVDMEKRWKGFDWNVIVVDGHDHDALRKALTDTSNPEHKPTVVIANTVKGKGISFMQNDILWHYRFPHEGWEYNCAVNELHQGMPEGVVDPYTPDGCPEMTPEPDGLKHTVSETYHPTYYTREVEER